MGFGVTSDWINQTSDWIQAKAGRTAGIWIALGLMVAAGIYVRPAVKAVVLGLQYAALSDDLSRAFTGNPVAFRILTPLISNLLGFHGHLIIITNLLVAAALLATIYYLFKARTGSSGDALAATAVIAFSLVTLTTIYYGGYTDSMTYLLVFLMWWFRQKRLIFYVLFLLALLNRECVLFLIPWYAYLRWVEISSKLRATVDLATGFALVLCLYMTFRWWMGSQGIISLGWEYYLSPLARDPLYWLKDTYPLCGLGLFTVLKLCWCVPILAGWDLWRRGKRSEVYSMMILTICVLAQLLVAVDSSRMMTLVFPVVLMGLLHLFQTNAFSFRSWVGYLLVGNLLVPQLYTAASFVEVMRSVPGNIVMILLQGKGSW